MIRNYRMRRILFLLSFFLLLHSVQSQKVCLVLSGGGAKGVSHVGVIKALEDNGVPIDCIVGTSMGAIVGGMYASGYSTDEMISFLKSDEIRNIVSGTIPPSTSYYFKEPHADARWIDFRLDYDSIKGSSFLPSNIVSTLLLDFAFMEMFSQASAVAGNDFNNLMVPLRFVAADITNRELNVFRDGNLSVSLRAAMTYPFYFKPIRIDGKLMYDGGMYNNFPADIALEEFDPDVIIGSKAAGNYEPPAEDDIISQLQSMLMENIEYSVPEGKGVLIEPELYPVNVIDFSHTEAFIDSGYIEALRHMDEIRQYVTRRSTVQEMNLKRRNFNERKPPLVIKEINIKGLNENQAHYVRKSILRRNDTINIDLLREEYFKLVSDDLLENVFPYAEYNSENNYFNLYLDFKRENNLILQVGGNISSSPINEAYIGAQFSNLSRIAFCSKGSINIGRFYSAAQVDAKVEFPFRIPFYLKGTLSFNQWDYFETSTYFFEDKTPSYLIQNENHVDLKLGLPAGLTGKVLLSGGNARMKDEYYHTNTFTRADTADVTYFDLFTGGITYEVNTMNKKQFANAGSLLRIQLRYIKGNEKNEPGSTSISEQIAENEHDWFRFKVLYRTYFNDIGIYNIGLHAEVLMSTQENFSNYVSSVLMAPAFQPIPESRTLFLPQFRSYNYGALGLLNVFALHKRIDLRLEGYVFQPYQEILEEPDQKAELGPLFENHYFLGSSSLVYHSPIGPVSLSLNYYDQRDNPFSFLFNFGYIIFNRKAIEK